MKKSQLRAITRSYAEKNSKKRIAAIVAAGLEAEFREYRADHYNRSLRENLAAFCRSRGLKI